MKLRMTVTLDQEHGGETFKLLCTTQDFLAWEKAGPNRSAMRMIRMDCTVTDLMSLAFAALRRQGLWGGKERELMEHAQLDLGWADADPEDEPNAELEDVDPTRSDRSGGE